MRNGASLVLLLLAGTGLGCRPEGNDFEARRVELEQQFAVLRNALDDIDARLSCSAGEC